jgi:hypothetical protein
MRQWWYAIILYEYICNTASKMYLLTLTCLSVHLSVRLAESVFMEFGIMFFDSNLSVHSKFGCNWTIIMDTLHAFLYMSWAKLVSHLLECYLEWKLFELMVWGENKYPYSWSKCLTHFRTIAQNNFQNCYALHTFHSLYLLLCCVVSWLLT